jgi:hypothetical protein
MQLKDESFSRFLSRAGIANLRAYQHSEYEPRRLEEVIARTAAARAIQADGYCFFNDIRFDQRSAAPAPVADTTDPRALMDQTRISVPGWDNDQKGSKFFLFLHELRSEAVLTLCADSRLLAPRGSADYLRDLEWLLVTAQEENGDLASLRDALRERRP